MGSLTNAAEKALLDHTFGVSPYTPAATLYLAFCTSEPGEGASGATIAEASYGGYQRKAISFGAAASRAITQNSPVAFDKATSGNETYTHYAILDSATLGAGEVLAYGSLTEPINVVTDNTPTVTSGQVEISLTTDAGVSDYLATSWLDFMFNNAAFAAPSIHIALLAADATNDLTGSTISEPTAASYARLPFSSWAAAVAGDPTSLDNSAQAAFPTTSESFGTITGTALVDALSGGNLLSFDNGGFVDQVVSTGSDLVFPVGSLTVTLD